MTKAHSRTDGHRLRAFNLASTNPSTTAQLPVLCHLVFASARCVIRSSVLLLFSQIANPDRLTHLSSAYETPVQVKDLDFNIIILSPND